MKQLTLLICCFGALAGAADLGTAKTVYVLAMSQGLDQYLANRLVNEHFLQVVTDPKLADVILTDRLGEAFQAKLETISPTPDPDKDADADKDKPADQDKAKAGKPPGIDDPGSGPVNPFLAETKNKVSSAATLGSTFGRNRGMVFLVDAKSREVLWSTFELPRSTMSKDMDHTATEIVARLKKDLKKK